MGRNPVRHRFFKSHGGPDDCRLGLIRFIPKILGVRRLLSSVTGPPMSATISSFYIDKKPFTFKFKPKVVQNIYMWVTDVVVVPGNHT